MGVSKELTRLGDRLAKENEGVSDGLKFSARVHGRTRKPLTDEGGKRTFRGDNDFVLRHAELKTMRIKLRGTTRK